MLRGSAAPTNCPEASAAPPRPASAAGAGAGGDPEQLRLGREVGASDPGARAEAASADVAAFLQRVDEVFLPEEPFFGHKRLERIFARLDRYAAFGAGRPGAGLEFAFELVDAQAEECRWNRRAQRPRSAAYFIPLLEEVSKSWRRKSAEREEQAPPGWRSTWAYPKQKKNRRRGGNRGAGERSTNSGG